MTTRHSHADDDSHLGYTQPRHVSWLLHKYRSHCRRLSTVVIGIIPSVSKERAEPPSPSTHLSIWPLSTRCASPPLFVRNDIHNAPTEHAAQTLLAYPIVALARGTAPGPPAYKGTQGI